VRLRLPSTREAGAAPSCAPWLPHTADSVGRSVRYGLPFGSPDEADAPPLEERERLRGEAAKSLTNIDAAERKRRGLVGTVLGGATAVVGAGLFATGASPAARLAIAPLLFLALGFGESARTGL